MRPIKVGSCGLAIAVFTFAGDQTQAADGGTEQKTSSWLQVGGQIRGRFEPPSGTSLVNNNSDAYYLSRIRVNLTIRPVSWLKFFAETQDARTAGYDATPAPATVYNPFDLRQGYVEVSDAAAFKLNIRAGRQELTFGGERLIGASDWGMSRTFDSIDMAAAGHRAKVDLFAGSVVQIDPTRFDRHKPGEHLFGAYGYVKDILPGMNVEPYLLFKENMAIKSETGVTGDALVISPGARVFGKSRGRIDYTAEMVIQRGSYSSDRISALGASYSAGWTLNGSRLEPRISAEYNYASGDHANKDGLRGTFDQFYPTNHLYYGMIDQFGWKNLKTFRAGFDVHATKKLKIRTDYNDFYLATIQDGLYGNAGAALVLNRAANSGHIGKEINAIALYQYSKTWKFGTGYGHLFAGEFLKQSKMPFGYTYPYVMFVGSF
jgi:hypothetical protein